MRNISTLIGAGASPTAMSYEAQIEKKESLRSFILGQKENRRYLWVAAIGCAVQFIIFKLLYPFPDFISDSYNYIESAANNLSVNLWPIGYAKFLAFVHYISYSDTVLVMIQYFILQLSLLYFFYTIQYLYRPSISTAKILFFSLLFNPLSLYLSNCVLSDSLFTSTTIIWFSLLLWQIKLPNPARWIVGVILMGLAFTIRYTAIYYPIVSALALLFSRVGLLEKVAWIVAPALLFIPFIWFTQFQTKLITGTAEFSVFGGWQIANNALYMYGHIRVDSTNLPSETRELDQMVRQYYRNAPPGYFNFSEFPGTFFIKHAHAPLKRYMIRYYKNELNSSSFLAWGKVSPIYNTYGTYLIKHYPLAFARYYLWLNIKNYFNPFLEKFETYNLESDSVWSSAQDWFHYPNPRVRSISKEFQRFIFFAYPAAFLLLNLYYLMCLTWLLATKKFRLLNLQFQKSLWLLAVFWIVNFGFSTLATPIVLRYQVAPMLLLFTFSILLLEFTDFKKPGNA